MWTMTVGPCPSKSGLFQSLSRDSTHVDEQYPNEQVLGTLVSIPQSGFDPCGR